MTNTLSISSNVFGFIAGGFSLAGFALTMVRSHLPSHKIKILETQLEETDSHFKGAMENGLLTGSEFIKGVQRRLKGLREETLRLQSRAYSATTLCKDYTEFFKGTSKEIGNLCHSLKELRAEIIRSGDAGQRRLQSVQTHNSIPSLPALPRPVRTRQPDLQDERFASTKPTVRNLRVILVTVPVALYDNNAVLDLESLRRIISSQQYHSTS